MASSHLFTMRSRHSSLNTSPARTILRWWRLQSSPWAMPARGTGVWGFGGRTARTGGTDWQELTCAPKRVLSPPPRVARPHLSAATGYKLTRSLAYPLTRSLAYAHRHGQNAGPGPSHASAPPRRCRPCRRAHGMMACHPQCSLGICWAARLPSCWGPGLGAHTFNGSAAEYPPESTTSFRKGG